MFLSCFHCRRSEWIQRSGNFALVGLEESSFENRRICSTHFTGDDVKYISKTGIKVLKDSALPIDYAQFSADSPAATDGHFNNEHVDSNIDCNNSTLPKNLLLNVECPILVKEANPRIIHVDDEPTCSSKSVHQDEVLISSNRNINGSRVETMNVASDNSINKYKELAAKLQVQLDAANKKNDLLIKKNTAMKNGHKREVSKWNKKVVNYKQIIKRKQRKIVNLERKIVKTQEEKNFYQNFKRLNKSVLSFFEMQVNHLKLKKWTDQEKKFAISLFYKSPKAYGYLRDEQEFILPCVSLIRRWVNELDLKPGKSDNLLELLKSKSQSMSIKERECVLIWDEMSIKSWLEYNSKKDIIEGYTDLGEHGRSSTIGNHVLVFMIRGRQSNWRQPISYYVSHNSVSGNDLHKIILDMLDYVEQSGFLVKTMVCDLGSPNQSAIKKLNISVETPFIERYNRKIFFNYDPPHLMKCLRNTFKNRELKIDNKNVAWGAIVELYDKEKDKPCKSAPKLSYRHINPNCFDLMNVSLATQIFSHTVSAALLAGRLANCDPLTHPDSIATANFLQKINDLFDCLNSRTSHDRNPFRRPLSENNIKVIEYLQDCLPWIETWECIDNKPKPPCFHGFSLTIKSILAQWEDIKKNDGLYLLTSRLNQDPLENLFAVLRSRSGDNNNPTAMQLRRNLQYTITANLTSLSKVTNCEPDSTEPLLAISELEPSKDLQSSCETSPYSALELDTTNQLHPDSESNLLNDISIDEVCQSNSESHENDNNLESLMTDYVEGWDTEIPFNEEVHESTVNIKNDIVPLQQIDSDIGDIAVEMNTSEETMSVNSSSKSSLGNLSEKYDQILCNPDDSSTPVQATVKYVAGYVAMKCFSKFRCSNCKSLLTRENLNFEKNEDLLIFFKAYSTIDGKNELGNLCVPSDDFTSVIATAVEVFHTQFPYINHCANIGQILYDKIDTVIQQNHLQFWNIEGSCRAHREFIITFFVRVHIFFKLKWMNRDLRDAKRSRKNEIASNKPNQKLQKLSHM